MPSSETKTPASETWPGSVTQNLEELVVDHRRDERAGGGTEAAADGQPETDAQVADHQSPSQSADAPKGPAEEAISQFRGRGRPQYGNDVGRRRRGQRPRHDDQPENGVNEPVALPGPVFHLLERQVEDGPGQSAEDEDQHAQTGIDRRIAGFRKKGHHEFAPNTRTQAHHGGTEDTGEKKRMKE